MVNGEDDSDQKAGGKWIQWSETTSGKSRQREEVGVWKERRKLKGVQVLLLLELFWLKGIKSSNDGGCRRLLLM